MKKVLVIFFTFLFFLGMSACGQSTEKQWQEQYDLGVRYLSEGNYEEAILAFTAAIEIDPKRPEAYAKAAEAYEAAGDPEGSRAILEQGYAETENEDLLPAPVPLEGYPKTERRDYENGEYGIEKYNAYGHMAEWTWYRADGNLRLKDEYIYDENQILLERCQERWEDNGDWSKHRSFLNPNGRIYKEEESCTGTSTYDSITTYAYVPNSTRVYISCHREAEEFELKLSVDKQAYDMESPNNMVAITGFGISWIETRKDENLKSRSLHVLEYTEENSNYGSYMDTEAGYKTTFYYDKNNTLIEIKSGDR